MEHRILNNLKIGVKTASLIAFWSLILGGSTAQAQGTRGNGKPAAGSNKTGISPSLERQFKRDAARLALRVTMEKGEDARYLPVIIPRDNVASLYKALIAIYNSDETAKSIARCNVHTYPNPSIDHLVIIYKRNVEWAGMLRQGVTETTSPAFNKLLEQYDLVIEKHVQWNETLDAVTIRSKELLNMAALASKFDDIAGVVQIDLGLPKVAGNDIKVRRVQDGWEFDFISQFGGAGSNKQHVWRYKALYNGQASFVKEWGDPIPAWMRCSMDNQPVIATNR
ncbi:MAG: hypothetical protein RL757_3215 [Bacteroidota bacterium]|jgi:hypothetical protein